MSTLDMTFSDAVEELTGEEVDVIERQYGAAFEKLSATNAMFAVVWIYERRNDHKLPLRDVKAWSLKKVRGYFADDEVKALDSEADFQTGA